MRRILLLLALCGTELPKDGLAAQAEEPIDSTIARLGAKAEVLREAWKAAVEDPETLNLILEQLFAGERWRLLRDLNLRFATFEADGADLRGLGLSYDYAKMLKRDDLINQGTHQAGLIFALNASGNVAFNRELNPRDFLRADGRLAFWRSRGGAVATSTEVRQRLAEIQTRLALITEQAELDASPLWAEYLTSVASHLTTQLYLDLGASAGIESDQAFDQTQYVYMANLGIDLKAWGRNSRLAVWNVFDWPFAAIRYLTGTDERFTPRGSNIPVLRLELGLVDPAEADLRESLGEAGAFPRLELEAAMRNLIVRSGLGDVYVESDVRWYRELGAPVAIAAAGLDEFTYFVAALVSSDGPYISYSTGRLPFDDREDQVYELGFRLHF